MAETVGQHSVAAFTSPVNGTTPIDANTVRGNDNTVRSAYVDHDADPGIHVQSSSLASRPVAGTVGRKWITVSSGRYQLWYDDGSRWHEVASDAVNVDCLADANLTKGDVIKITGFNNGQNLPTVNKVSASTDTAFGIVENTVTSGNIVQIVNTGLIEDVDTNGYAVGTILYPNSSGAWTTTKPTSGNYQPAGYVLRGNTNNGVLYVEFSAPRIVERSDNTASTIVLRDASGNFSAGTITATALTASGAVSAGSVTSTGLVTFASLKGTGATTVTNILDEDNMASDSATALATQQSIKAYVDAKVATVDTLAEVLANGNTTGANNIIVTNGQKITTNTIDETTAAAGVTIDSVLLKDDVVNATDIEVDTISANNGTLAVTLGSTGVATIAQQPILSSLTASQAVFTDASKGLVSNAITGTGNVVMSASPTLTGTVTAATINATTLGGTLSTAAQPNVTSLGTLANLTVTNPISGSVTGSSGSTTGNAATATALQTARNINGVSFNGTADITVTAAAGTLTGTTLASGITASSLTSVGTLTSLTVSGDLTVDTSTLKVDSTNNRVGVGTASPAVPLDVAGTSARIKNTGGSASLVLSRNANTAGATIDLNTGDTNKWFFGLRGLSDDKFYFYNNVGGDTALTIDTSGNLGVGTTGPQARVHTSSANQGSNGGIIIENTGSGGDKYSIWPTATANGEGAGKLIFTNNGGNRVTIDSSGNLGVGTTSPRGPLHVGADLNNGATDAAAINLKQTSTTAATGIYLERSGERKGYYLYVGGDQDSLTFQYNNAGTKGDTMSLTRDGNVGVGTASPGYRLDVSGDIRAVTTGTTRYIIAGSDTQGAVFQQRAQASWGDAFQVYRAGNLKWALQEGSDAFIVSVNSAERARITSGGLFQVTADGANQTFTNSGQIALKNTGSAPYISWHESTGARIGYLQMQSTGSANLYVEANQPLVFATNNTERARITSGGYFKASNAGTYFSSTGSQHELRSNSSSATTFILSNSASSFAADMMYINVGNSSGTGFNLINADTSAGGQFRVRGDGTIYAQNTTVQSISDARLKDNVTDATDGLAVITALRPVRYDWKAGYGNDRKNQLGFIAQEMEAVFPEAVSEWEMDEPTGEVDEDGKPITEKVDYKTVGPGALIPVLVKAIQELEARIAVLEAGA